MKGGRQEGPSRPIGYRGKGRSQQSVTGKGARIEDAGVLATRARWRSGGVAGGTYLRVVSRGAFKLTMTLLSCNLMRTP